MLNLDHFASKKPVFGTILAAILLLAACNAPTPVGTPIVLEPSQSSTVEIEIIPTQMVSAPSPTSQPDAYPPPEGGSTSPAIQQAATISPAVETPDDAYPPPPGVTQADPGQSAYPPPGTVETLPTSEQAYPGPSFPTPPGAAPTLGTSPSPVPTQSGAAGTPGSTPTDRVGMPAMPPPGADTQTVTLWHSWNVAEAQVLEEVLAAFQKLFPNIYFDVLYVPYDDLLMTFQSAAYRRAGPDLLLAPADWGPELFDTGMIAPLNDLAIPDFLDRINPAALESARYRGNIISLPHSIREGIVMYRNREIIPRAPSTFSELVSAAQTATRGGRVGAYLERGFYYSAGHLGGIGGRLMDENGNPAFNNQKGTDWLNLLVEFEQAGPVSANTNRDLDLFKAGRVGIIIDGTWNREALVTAIGDENLYIDPWPTYQDGRLSGFIRTDNIYLTSRAEGDERYASLQFIGFMLAPEVQTVLTRAGHIPALIDVDVDTDWMNQAMTAFIGSAPYLTHPNSPLYWDPLETAIGYVFNKTTLPEPALVQARDTIAARIRENQASP